MKCPVCERDHIARKGPHRDTELQSFSSYISLATAYQTFFWCSLMNWEWESCWTNCLVNGRHYTNALGKGYHIKNLFQLTGDYSFVYIPWLVHTQKLTCVDTWLLCDLLWSTVLYYKCVRKLNRLSMHTRASHAPCRHAQWQHMQTHTLVLHPSILASVVLHHSWHQRLCMDYHSHVYFHSDFILTSASAGHWDHCGCPHAQHDRNRSCTSVCHFQCCLTMLSNLIIL